MAQGVSSRKMMYKAWIGVLCILLFPPWVNRQAFAEGPAITIYDPPDGTMVHAPTVLLRTSIVPISLKGRSMSATLS